MVDIVNKSHQSAGAATKKTNHMTSDTDQPTSAVATAALAHAVRPHAAKMSQLHTRLCLLVLYHLGLRSTRMLALCIIPRNSNYSTIKVLYHLGLT
jgi:hypothetical protein